MSSNYWENRSLDLMKNLYNNQEKKNKVLITEYKKALKDIKLEISNLYEKLDNNISLSEGYKYDRLIKLEKQIDERIKELSKVEVNFNEKSLKDNYIEASKKVSNNLNIEFVKLPIETVEKAINYPWSGHAFSEIIWKNTDKLAYNIKNIITRGLIEGKSYIDMARELNKLMDNAIYNSLRVIRTETAHIVNSATIDRYNNKNVKKVQIIAAADERTCKVCGTLHMQIYNIDKVPMLPSHAQCRCCYAPVVDIE